MERKIFFGILAITLLALAAAILLPGGRTIDEHPKLPWNLQVNDEGTLTVFGIELGKSDLNQARNQFQDQGKANLFLTPDNRYMVEAYFQRIYLSGLKADLVLTLDLPETRAAQMFERGERISNMGSGTKKIELSSRDMEALAREKIKVVTYIPAADLDETLIVGRFGEPEKKLADSDSAIVHWLYPSKGLDIAVNSKGKEVLQYVNPADFGRVMTPLQH
ncbi:hypothetical protein [Sedimenticola sp.]|uniref:hypothetical protein n=1 Tax=Sedimenticola sp. TaxID=1940285 RepID=UPI003D0FAED7